MSANDHQVGGEHYKQFGELQPWDVVLHFQLGFLDGNAVRYLLRWRHKGGVEDLRKARHYLDKLIEHIEDTDARQETMEAPTADGRQQEEARC